MPHLPATSALVRGAALLAQGLLLACAAPAPAPSPAPRLTPSQAAPARTPDRPRDPHSFARPHQVVATHLDLALHVSFADSALDGVATYTLDRHDLSAPFVLDARGLQIHRVELAPRADDRSANTWSPARWTLGSAHPQLGAPYASICPKQTPPASGSTTEPETPPASSGSPRSRPPAPTPSSTANPSRSSPAPGCRSKTAPGSASPTTPESPSIAPSSR